MLSDLDELTVKSAAAAIDALATFMYTNSRSQLETYGKVLQLVGDPQAFWPP